MGLILGCARDVIDLILGTLGEVLRCYRIEDDETRFGIDQFCRGASAGTSGYPLWSRISGLQSTPVVLGREDRLLNKDVIVEPKTERLAGILYGPVGCPI